MTSDEDIAALLPLLPTLVAVARTRHVTRAASELGVNQSTVSRDLAKAHAILNTGYVARSRWGVELTPAGDALLPYLLRAVSSLQAGLKTVDSSRPEARSHITVGLQIGLSSDTPSRSIRRFRKSNQQASFLIEQADRFTCLQQIADGTMDIAFVTPGADISDSNSHSVDVRSLVLIVPRTHKDARNTSISIADVSESKFLVPSEVSDARAPCDKLLGRRRHPTEIVFEGTDFDTVRALVDAGLGLAILPTRPESESRAGTVDIKLTDPGAVCETLIVWANHLSDDGSPSAAFRDFIVESAEGQSV